MTLKGAPSPALDKEEKEGDRGQRQGSDGRRERNISWRRRIGPGRGQKEAREAEALQTGMRRSASLSQVFTLLSGAAFVILLKIIRILQINAVGANPGFATGQRTQRRDGVRRRDQR